MDNTVTSQYTYKLIRLSIPEPAQLVAMFTKEHRLVFCCIQVFSKCLSKTCSYTKWMSAIKSQPRGKLVSLNAADKLMLVKLGAVSSRAQNVRVMSVAVTCKALADCKAGSAIVSAFDRARRHPDALSVMPFPAHMLQPCGQPSPNPPGLQLLSPLPVNLPPCLITPGRRYGLAVTKPDLWASNPLKQHMSELKQHTMAAIQLDRQAQAHGTRTWQNNEAHISLYLGYCYHCHSIMLPTLQLYLAPDLMAAYISFRMAAQHSSLSIKHNLSTAATVMRWWQTKPGGHDPSLVACLEWLARLGTQVHLHS